MQRIELPNPSGSHVFGFELPPEGAVIVMTQLHPKFVPGPAAMVVPNVALRINGQVTKTESGEVSVEIPFSPADALVCSTAATGFSVYARDTTGRVHQIARGTLKG